MRFRRGLKEERGTSLVEFALVLPVLILILFGLLDAGKAFNYANDQTHLAAEGARWAVVNTNPGGGTLQEYILDQADTDELQSLAEVCISFPTNPETGSSGQVGDPVVVTVKSDYDWLPFLPMTPIQINRSATMRLEALPTNFSAGGGGTGSCA
jgi:hypothetical protein